jgi:hypothetical protein
MRMQIRAKIEFEKEVEKENKVAEILMPMSPSHHRQSLTTMISKKHWYCI